MQDLNRVAAKEKVVLAVVDQRGRDGWLPQEIAQELESCVEACQGKVVETVLCRADKPNPAYLIGKGKVAEIAALCADQQIDTVVFSANLKGSQQRNLEEMLDVKTIDYSQLILDIFARRATSQEGKMQVELAQLEYLLPRLVGKGIALSRLGGGIGTLGPGETKLEIDRRRIAQRIAKLQRALTEVAATRAVKRKKRKDKGVPLISLVGYTNAGKSTLLNALTQAGQETRDGLFTTLDSLARQLVLTNHRKVVLSDTVGFMHDLPHHLIEAFQATLEEVCEADILLHVLDISHPHFMHLHQSVMRVLSELGAENKIMITALNKIDKLSDQNMLKGKCGRFDNAVAISAQTGENIPTLLDRITAELISLNVDIDVLIPISRMDLVSRAHNEGQVYSVKYYNDSIHIRASLPQKLAGLFFKESN